MHAPQIRATINGQTFDTSASTVLAHTEATRSSQPLHVWLLRTLSGDHYRVSLAGGGVLSVAPMDYPAAKRLYQQSTQRVVRRSVAFPKHN